MIQKRRQPFDACFSIWLPPSDLTPNKQKWFTPYEDMNPPNCLFSVLNIGGIRWKRTRAESSSYNKKTTNGTTHNFVLVKLCLTFLATQQNVQALWHSLLEKLVIVLICPCGRAALDACYSLIFVCTVWFLLYWF